MYKQQSASAKYIAGGPQAFRNFITMLTYELLSFIQKITSKTGKFIPSCICRGDIFLMCSNIFMKYAEFRNSKVSQVWLAGNASIQDLHYINIHVRGFLNLSDISAFAIWTRVWVFSKFNNKFLSHRRLLTLLHFIKISFRFF